MVTTILAYIGAWAVLRRIYKIGSYIYDNWPRETKHATSLLALPPHLKDDFQDIR